MKGITVIVLFFITSFSFARSFDDVFPDLDPAIKKTSFSGEEYYYCIERNSDNSYNFTIKPDSNIKISKEITDKKPNYIIETLLVVPPINNNKITLADIYNALGQTSLLAGRKYFSFTRKKSVPLFKTVRRIKDEKNTDSLPDPSFYATAAENEDIYFLVDDINFGYCYYLSKLTSNASSISYKLTNIADVSFYFITVAKKENININFYIEPITEGVLIYAVTGMKMEKFAASKVDVPSAAKKRFDVVREWIVDGINAPHYIR